MLPILSFIPDPLKQQIADSLVQFLAEQARKTAGDQLAEKIRGFSSQRSLYQAVEQALKKGAERFVAEYAEQDEDLVAAISADPDFWKSPKVQAALGQMIRRPGAWLEGERQAVAQHFDDVLPGRRNRQRVDQAVTFFLTCVVEELWTLPGTKEVREVYALQFQRISAEAAKEQAALARQQLQATHELNAEMRQALLQLTAALEQRLLAAPAVPVALPRPLPYHNLPRPDYARFVGRENELAWLRQRLSPADRAWQVAVTGIGGVGKSALALAVAHEYRQNYEQLPPEERFDAIIWVSAKEEVLTVQGRQQANLPELVLHTLEDVYTVIARALEREDITRAVAEDQGRLVERALKEQRTLLLMDNLESVKDERVKPFLRNLPAPTKAIITSREWLDVADVLSMKGLEAGEAEQLIAGEAELRQVQLDAAQRQRLYELTSGLPLPLKLAVARLSGGENFPAVERWLGDAAGELPEYCIQGQAELARQRDANTWKLLLACALFDRGAGASREALGYVADLSLADRDRGLAQLQRLFLVNCTEKDRFWVLPIVQRYAGEQLSGEGDRQQIVERWLEWLVQFARANGKDLRTRIELLPIFEQEYPNLLNAIRWCREHQHWNTLFDLAEQTWRFPDIVGLHQEWEEIIAAADLDAKATSDERKYGRIEAQRGRLAFLRGAPAETIYGHLDTAEKISLRYQMYADIGDIQAVRAHVLQYENQLEKAEIAAKALLDWSREVKNLKHQFVAADRLVSIEIDKSDIQQAKFWLNECEKIARQLDSTRTFVSVQYRRARLAIKIGNFEDAEALLLDIIAKTSSWKGLRHVADDHYRLAQVYLATIRIQLAHQHVEEALALYQRLGMNREVEKTQRLLAQIAQHEQASEAA